MMEISEIQFALLCYNVRMQDIMTKSIDMQMEKSNMVHDGYWAWQRLDLKHQTDVLMYLKRWGYDVPQWVKDYERDLRKEFSQDYPLGGSLEPYDIERDKNL